MLALSVQSPHDLIVRDVAPPGSPEAGEILLRVERAGICGSDIHIFCFNASTG